MPKFSRHLGALFAGIALSAAPAAAWAADASASPKQDYSTVGSGPQFLTAGELAKIAALNAAAPAAAPQPMPADPLLQQLLAKPAPVSTVVPVPAADIEARTAAKLAQLAAPSNASPARGIVGPPPAAKERETSTVMQGPPGLNAVETAKTDAAAAKSSTNAAPALPGRSDR